jgi:hypothetical protein
MGIAKATVAVAFVLPLKVQDEVPGLVALRAA